MVGEVSLETLLLPERRRIRDLCSAASTLRSLTNSTAHARYHKEEVALDLRRISGRLGN